MHPFDREFDRHFKRTERNIKRFGIATVIMMLPAIVLFGAIAVAILYFIAFAITHWLRW